MAPWRGSGFPLFAQPKNDDHKAPYKLILRHGDYFVWDYSNMHFFLQGLMSELGFLSGQVGNLKSENFENEVLQLIGNTRGVEPWEGRKVLSAQRSPTPRCLSLCRG